MRDGWWRGEEGKDGSQGEQRERDDLALRSLMCAMIRAHLWVQAPVSAWGHAAYL